MIEEIDFINTTLFPLSISAGFSIDFCSMPRFEEDAVVIVVLASRISSSSGGGGPTIVLRTAACLVYLRGARGLYDEDSLIVPGAVNSSTAFFLTLRVDRIHRPRLP